MQGPRRWGRKEATPASLLVNTGASTEGARGAPRSPATHGSDRCSSLLRPEAGSNASLRPQVTLTLDPDVCWQAVGDTSGLRSLRPSRQTAREARLPYSLRVWGRARTSFTSGSLSGRCTSTMTKCWLVPIWSGGSEGEGGRRHPPAGISVGVLFRCGGDWTRGKGPMGCWLTRAK